MYISLSDIGIDSTLPFIHEGHVSTLELKLKYDAHHEGGKKYCRRCKVYYCQNGVFCPCCHMALRVSPNNNRDKERLRQLTLREEEQDRIIRIIKGIKK